MDTALMALTPNFEVKPQPYRLEVWRAGRWVEVDPSTYTQPTSAGVKAAVMRVAFDIDRVTGNAVNLRFAQATPAEKDMFAPGAYRGAGLGNTEIIYPPNCFQHADSRWAAAGEIEARRKQVEQQEAA